VAIAGTDLEIVPIILYNQSAYNLLGENTYINLYYKSSENTELLERAIAIPYTDAYNTILMNLIVECESRGILKDDKFPLPQEPIYNVHPQELLELKQRKKEIID
jgi:hypothetical protein